MLLSRRKSAVVCEIYQTDAERAGEKYLQSQYCRQALQVLSRIYIGLLEKVSVERQAKQLLKLCYHHFAKLFVR